MMHGFQLRYVAVGLLFVVAFGGGGWTGNGNGAFARPSTKDPTTSIIQTDAPSATSRHQQQPTTSSSATPSSCLPGFDDLASKTAVAQTIVRATVHRVRRDAHDRFTVRFRVEKVLKGNIPEMDAFTTATVTTTTTAVTTIADALPPSVADDSTASTLSLSLTSQSSLNTVPSSDDSRKRHGRAHAQPPTITVASFARRPDHEDCVAPEVTLGGRYLVFLQRLVGDSSVAESADAADNVYHISGFPVNATDENIAAVQRFVTCSKCTRRPKVKLSPSQKTLKSGQKLRLSCQASGKPRPLVTWFKDGFHLPVDGRVKITHSKRGSQLTIRRTTPFDAGFYECQATNVIARTQKVSSTVVISPPDSPTLKPFTELCERQDYCFNGGTCRIMISLDRHRFCECTADHEGPRCQEKKTGLAGLTRKRRRWARHQHDLLYRRRRRQVAMTLTNGREKQK